MTAPRPYAGVSTRDQWLRAAYEHTTYDEESGAVELDWEAPAPLEVASAVAAVSGALAFDSHCRLYRSRPTEGRIERMLWAARSSATPATPFPDPVELLHALDRAILGDFEVRSQPSLFTPRGLAFDSEDRLFVADAARRCVLVIDPWSGRVRRAASWPSSVGGPVDLAAHGDTIYVVTSEPVALFRMTAQLGPIVVPLASPLASAARIAVSTSGRIAILSGVASAEATVIIPSLPGFSQPVPWGSDLEIVRDDTLVVARQPSSDFLRFRLHTGPARSAEQLPPLKARGYDGQAIVRTPDGSLGFFGAEGFRIAVAARLRFARQGRVTTYRLDSGDFQTQWGRLFVDACMPPGATIRIECRTEDDPRADAQTLPRTPPSKLEGETVVRPDLSPPMPPLSLVPPKTFTHALFARTAGRELPWAPAPDGGFRTYELPIDAPPGRYLWIFLELTGNTRVSPRVSAIRAEYPSHDLLSRVPAVFSRDPQSADFLRRFLAMFDGFLGDLEGRAAARHLLLIASATPAQFLPWLASFVGLVMDERWSEQVRRTFIAESAWLFRFRGTRNSLTRMLEIAIGLTPVLAEHFRFRGLGAAAVGSTGPASSASILGAGFRVGGAVNSELETPLAGAPPDAFETHAHRFSVLVPRALNADEMERAKFILEQHRPAHTQYEICSSGGMRTGIGLHVGISSFVGCTASFSTLQLTRSTLGSSAIVGWPEPGFAVGSTPLCSGPGVR